MRLAQDRTALAADGLVDCQIGQERSNDKARAGGAQVVRGGTSREVDG